MNFEIWKKVGSGPYRRATLDDLFSQTDNACILVETQQEADILEGFQLIFGGELDIRIIEPSSSVNPWVYNRVILFYTFNPLERAFS
jgi:hypothetical protein